MTAPLHDKNRYYRLDHFLDELRTGQVVYTDWISHEFCLSNAKSAGKLLSRRDDLEKINKGEYRKREMVMA